MKKVEKLKPDKESLKYIRAWCRCYPDWIDWLEEPSSYIPQHVAFSLVTSLPGGKRSEEENILLYKEKIEENIALLKEAVNTIVPKTVNHYAHKRMLVFNSVAYGWSYTTVDMKDYISKSDLYTKQRQVYNYLYLKLMVK